MTNVLDGVATVDHAGNLYFVSLRSYSTTLSTIYTATFTNGDAFNATLVTNVSRMVPGWVDFDVEVSADGNTLYISEGFYSVNPFPDVSNFLIARKGTNGFSRVPESAAIFTNINTAALAYAACISSDDREFFFTRLNLATNPPTVGIYRAARASPSDPFEPPQRVTAISGGFFEGPTLSPDGRILYYHRQDMGAGLFFLECVTRFPTSP